MNMTKQTCGIIGVGAFGEFMLKFVTPYFNVRVYDAYLPLDEIAATYNLDVVSFEDVCRSDIVVLAVPVGELEKTVAAMVPFLRAGQLVMDLCSVKCKPVEILKRLLPENVDAISLHPLFGPQSGKNGIGGLNVTVCNVAGDRAPCVVSFLQKNLGLKTFETTPENHDREMAYVQGLTHMIARVFVRLDVPEIHQQTKTYALLNDMVELVRYDSEELFLAIQRDNPFVKDTTDKFFEAVKILEDKLNAAAHK
ncbi:MAG: prephenate dehydrogenase [Pseudobdellovibrionaceae bacterium]